MEKSIQDLQNWADALDASVTVADKDGIILYMNQKAKSTLAKNEQKMIGASLFDCHPEPAKSKLKALYSEKKANHYTIEKPQDGGSPIKKIIHQLPWYKKCKKCKKEKSGEKFGKIFAGYVEISIQIPIELPHFIRGKK